MTVIAPARRGAASTERPSYGDQRQRSFTHVNVVTSPVERLVTASEIDNAQTSMGKRGPLIGVQANAVGTSVADDVAHRDRTRLIVRRQSVAGNDSSNAAHVRPLSLARRIPAVRPPHHRR